MGTQPNYVSVPFESCHAELAMRLSTRLSQEGEPFRLSLAALLEPPTANQPISTISPLQNLVETARRILRSSEPGRRAVILAMAQTPGAEVRREALLAAYAKAAGVKKPSPKQLCGLLASFVRRARKEKALPPYYDSHLAEGTYFYKMTAPLAKAFLEAAKEKS